MAKHCFVDESGTMPDQEIMTVALVMLEGGRTAEKLHPKLAKAIFQAPKLRGLKEREQWYESRQLHYAEMEDGQKLAIGKELAKAKINVFVGHCAHTIESEEHEYRFTMYRELVKKTVNAAFETCGDLIVSVAKQGGWEDYGASFLAELRRLPQSGNRLNSFRKGDFFLASPAKQGLQIADFYASSSWNFLQSGGQANRGGPFELIRHQVHLEEMVLTKELV